MGGGGGGGWGRGFEAHLFRGSYVFLWDQNSEREHQGEGAGLGAVPSPIYLPHYASVNKPWLCVNVFLQEAIPCHSYTSCIEEKYKMCEIIPIESCLRLDHTKGYTEQATILFLHGN